LGRAAQRRAALLRRRPSSPDHRRDPSIPRPPPRPSAGVGLATVRAPAPPAQPIRGEASEGGRSPPPRFLAAEVQTLDLRIRQQRGPRPLEAVSPELQRVGAVG